MGYVSKYIEIVDDTCVTHCVNRQALIAAPIGAHRALCGATVVDAVAREEIPKDEPEPAGGWPRCEECLERLESCRV